MNWITICTVAGPWFSLGFHIDFQHRYIDLHIIWWIITLGTPNSNLVVECGNCGSELPSGDVTECANCGMRFVEWIEE